jgi:hypothetical protein
LGFLFYRVTAVENTPVDLFQSRQCGIHAGIELWGEIQVIFENQDPVETPLPGILKDTQMTKKATSCANARETSSGFGPNRFEQADSGTIESQPYVIELPGHLAPAILPVSQVDDVNPFKIVQNVHVALLP